MATKEQVKPFLDSGVEIICPHCKQHIAYTTKKIEKGSSLKSDMFFGPGVSRGGKMKCDRCGMPWFIKETGQIHTKMGWQPQHY